MSVSQLPFEDLIDRTLGGFPRRQTLRDELEAVLLWLPHADDDARARAVLDWVRASEAFQSALFDAIAGLVCRRHPACDWADLGSEIYCGFMEDRLRQWSPLKGRRLFQYLVWETRDCIRYALRVSGRAPIVFSDLEAEDGEEFEVVDEADRDRPEAAFEKLILPAMLPERRPEPC